jgi:hypothetical protein
MTYSSGQRIQADHYNTIAWTNPSIGGHWGVGYGNHGLGQSTSAITAIPLPPTTLTPVTAVQWTNLFTTINKCLNHHQLSSVVPSGPIITGTPITAYSILAGASAAAYNSAGLAPAALSSSNPALSTVSYSTPWGTGSLNTLKQTGSITFASADAARYFFNAGGKISISVSRTGGSSTIANTNWQTLCHDVGTLSIGYNTSTLSSNTGSPYYVTGSGGYWNGTTSEVTQFRQYDASGGYYSSDFLQVNYKWSGSTSNGGYQTLDISVYFSNTTGVTIDGTTETAFTIVSPTTTYLPTASWGSPSFSGITTSTTAPIL